ncbi:SirB2 family protein [Shewanella sp. A3A]|uniref:SirB2 family protein n=1 Tax=Shewanella electrica TaxID=515560 RepID=A0ABT2FFL9_9GAMM|nr:SirB2 family protein [Shewanella electrica]MCH1918595.1 SirB2 family protein [Shewanella ferrihydritica]MCH1925255.1 SirB2 family protein [Shewanella electrica]MCS4555080.1 SirB2 family protein [Shewanella electrica]
MDNTYMVYMAVKHFHLTMIGLSVMLFIARFGMKLKGSALLQKKWLRIAPHAIDTLLLLSGASLCFIMSQYPIVDGWLTEKLVAVVAYILLAAMAMKADRGTMYRIFCFVGALAWLAFAAKLAMLKRVVFF